MDVEFYTGDNVEVVKNEIPDESIDLTVTSPPYDDLRTYNGFGWDIDAVIEQLWRVTKPGGVVVWVVGDKTHRGSETGTSFRTALKFMEVGWKLHDTMIYAKENPMPLKSNRYQPCFEYMFVFSKGKPNTFNPIMRRNARAGGLQVGTHRDKCGAKKTMAGTGVVKGYSPERNIWYYAVGKNNSTSDNLAFQHPAIFPEKLAEDHILSWSNEGDTVLDIFGGSGTTAKMALLNKRKSIYIDISEEYTNLAKKRLNV